VVPHALTFWLKHAPKGGKTCSPALADDPRRFPISHIRRKLEEAGIDALVIAAAGGRGYSLFLLRVRRAILRGRDRSRRATRGVRAAVRSGRAGPVIASKPPVLVPADRR